MVAYVPFILFIYFILFYFFFCCCCCCCLRFWIYATRFWGMSVESMSGIVLKLWLCKSVKLKELTMWNSKRNWLGTFRSQSFFFCWLLEFVIYTRYLSTETPFTSSLRVRAWRTSKSSLIKLVHFHSVLCHSRPLR